MKDRSALPDKGGSGEPDVEINSAGPDADHAGRLRHADDHHRLQALGRTASFGREDRGHPLRRRPFRGRRTLQNVSYTGLKPGTEYPGEPEWKI